MIAAMIPLAALALLFGGDPAPTTTATIVAGVQYAAGMWDAVDARCKTDDERDLCALIMLTNRAAFFGARLVVLPEHALHATVPRPEIGDAPFLQADATILQRLSAEARTLRVYLLADVITERDGSSFNTLIAFGPDGRVVARHDKFELYAGEAGSHTAGTRATVFETPFGKVGMLVCADIYGDHRLHERMIDEGVRLVAMSSWWTVKGAPSWPRHFAYNFGVHVISANTTAGWGRGGGFFTPRGDVEALWEQSAPGIVYGVLP